MRESCDGKGKEQAIFAIRNCTLANTIKLIQGFFLYYSPSVPVKIKMNSWYLKEFPTGIQCLVSTATGLLQTLAFKSSGIKKGRNHVHSVIVSNLRMWCCKLFFFISPTHPGYYFTCYPNNFVQISKVSLSPDQGRRTGKTGYLKKNSVWWKKNQ